MENVKTVSSGLPVWVMTFIDSCEVEIYASAEMAYKMARKYVMQENPEYAKYDLAALEDSYHENNQHFRVDDFLWVDAEDILTVIED